MSPEEYAAEARKVTVPLIYFRQIGTKIEHCFKGRDGAYHTEQITPDRALALAQDLIRFASYALKPSG